MYGVDGPFVGDTNHIRGVVGDEAPWEIAGFARGRLYSNGHLVILVRGLVFKDNPGSRPNWSARTTRRSFAAWSAA